MFKQTEESCTHCEDNVRQLFDFWKRPLEKTHQENYLIEEACPQFEDFGGCEVGVLEWWRQMNDVIFSSEGAVHGLCVGVGGCEEKT